MPITPTKPAAHKVAITINGQTIEVSPGNHPVAQLKTLPNPNIPKEDTLCEIINGVPTPLDDKAQIDIKGGEEFASNCPSGGAS